MTFQIIKRPAALRDIEECFVHIADNDLDIGVTFLVAIEDSLERIAEFPFIGKAKEFQNEKFTTVRMWPVKGFETYLIFYSVYESSIDVVRVLHGSRDIASLFD